MLVKTLSPISDRRLRDNTRIAVKKSEYMAMGPTPGCYCCKAIARGDRAHKPRNKECREIFFEWLSIKQEESREGWHQPG